MYITKLAVIHSEVITFSSPLALYMPFIHFTRALVYLNSGTSFLLRPVHLITANTIT